MKKIINGKKYDTETAKAVAFHSNNLSYRDFKWYDETLYQKRTGEFFLLGEGGAMSKYAQPVGNCMSNGMTIIPMSYDEAKQWAETNIDVDRYEQIFGEVEE